MVTPNAVNNSCPLPGQYNILLHTFIINLHSPFFLFLLIYIHISSFIFTRRRL